MRTGLILGCALFLLAAPTTAYEALEAIAPVVPSDFNPTGIRGVTIAPIEDGMLGDVGYGSSRCDLAVRQVAEVGATWVSITPFGRMDDLNSTDIQHDFEIPVLENETRIERTIAAAREAGMKVALIPHIYVMSGKWRGEIDPGDEENWEEWFRQYTSFVLRFARLAELNRVDLFSIGVEFKSSTNFRDTRWRQLIREVREQYSGPLTYSANWDEVDQVMFWDDLDFIGINAFWPLAGKPGDGLEEMSLRAGTVARDLEALAFNHDRPVLFTEMGVKSADDSALAPWEWPEDCDDLSYDENYQAVAYRAIFENMAEEPWFAGLFVWKYFADPYDETQEDPTGFSPQRKVAESELALWFDLDWDPMTLSFQTI